jgi:alpha,alpha-trehalase
MKSKIALLVLAIAFACQPAEKVETDFYKSDLFNDVQNKAIFPDSKTFVDCAAKRPLSDILSDYNEEKRNSGFDLRKFIEENFEPPYRPQSGYKSDSLISMEEHINKLWPVLTRQPDQLNSNSTLLPLPKPYIVPGGRFSEVYYWDSYFTMLGLNVAGKQNVMRDMIDNFAFLIDSIGFIPNANRNYYLTRSQPPFFSVMVKLLSESDTTALTKYLPQMQKEYEFWMHGSEKLQRLGDATEHVVNMPDGTILNRYYDKGKLPRPEAFKEDIKVAKNASVNPETAREAEVIYNSLRSAAESGWDFSSRWLKDGQTLETIQTTDIVPVDLNSLMHHLEMTLSQAYKMKGDGKLSKDFKRKADQRRRAILTFFWSPEQNFFLDYNFKEGKTSPVKSLAGMYPFFFKIVLKDIAEKAAVTLEKEFLKPGGLVTTLNVTGQQWDAPNGWAPLQWISYKGLKNYDIHPLANEIKKRWLRQNYRVYKVTHKMMEKYNVMDTTLQAGGGEYPNQDGFGWTNGVALALMKSN